VPKSQAFEEDLVEYMTGEQLQWLTENEFIQKNHVTREESLCFPNIVERAMTHHHRHM
jgi:hemerythrin superfamily protein